MLFSHRHFPNEYLLTGSGPQASLEGSDDDSTAEGWGNEAANDPLYRFESVQDGAP